MIFEILILIFSLLLCLFWYTRWNYGSLEKMGVRVIEKPWLIFGNALQTFEKPGGLMDIERMKKFGPIYGFYEGREPQIHICDAELIRIITTKDADYFDDKRNLDFGDSVLNEMPDFLPYDKWKIVRRNIITPAFSPAKLKLMTELMKETCQSFCDNLKNIIKSSPGRKLDKYDLRDSYFTMSSDLIAQSCFSVKLDNPHDSNNKFVSIVRDVLMSGVEAPQWLQILAYSFPILAKYNPVVVNPGKVRDFLQIFRQMMESRKKSGQSRPDLLEICLQQFEKLSTPEYKQAGITEQTILFQGFIFFFAAQDQISSISSYLVYFLLKNPEIEVKLYEEIDEFAKKHKGRLEYQHLYDLTYLNACITETLRFFPFFTRFERVCTKDWENKEYGLKIKKGTVIMIPIWAANRNRKYFEDPEQFKPERFLPENAAKLHNNAMTSFGFGPRNCPGIKFSYDVLMVLNFYALKHFKFHLRPDSKLEFCATGPLFTPNLPFYFDVSIRSEE